MVKACARRGQARVGPKVAWLGDQRSYLVIGVVLAAHVQQRTQFLRQNFGPFVTCLSESRDQLSQWRGYGAGGGYAIRFDSRGLRESVQRNSVHTEQPVTDVTIGQVPVGARRLVKMEYEASGQAALLRQQLTQFINAVAASVTTERQDQEMLRQRGKR